MRLRFLPLVVLLALVVSLGHVTGGPVDDDEEPSQIERPPDDDDLDNDGIDDDEQGDDTEEGNVDYNDRDEDLDGVPDSVDEDSEDFDVDYTVKRESHKAAEERECLDDDDDEDDDDSDDGMDCKKPEDNLKPYEKYPGYKNWKPQPLFIIIIGGLRWDYLTESTSNMTGKTVGKMKAFNWIKKHGSTLSQVVPVYPPYDLPTWTSLATGLYPQTTGVIGDYMFNLKTRELFKRGDSLENWWQEGEPIWSIAAKNGMNVSVLNWHDCTLPGRTIENPNLDCKPFDPSSPIPTKQKLIQLFNRAFTKIHGSKYHLSIVYTDAVKKAALRYGPDSKEVMKTLADLDDVLQGRLSDIKNKKERSNLKLNILLLSDYGLNGREKTTKLVLDDYLEFEHVQYIIQRGGSTVLIPYALKAADIMSGVGDKPGVGSMQGVDAYVRDVDLEVPPLEYPTIPEEFKYTGNAWTQDILLVAKPGFEIEIKNADNPKILPPWKGEEKGTSGYHPNPPPPHIVPGRDKHKSKELRAREKMESGLYSSFAHMMKTIGFAWGPDFKPGYVNEPIELVDLYQVMAFLLKVDPNQHHGDWDRVKGMMVLSSQESLLPSLCLSILLPLMLSRFV